MDVLVRRLEQKIDQLQAEVVSGKAYIQRYFELERERDQLRAQVVRLRGALVSISEAPPGSAHRVAHMALTEI